MDTCVTQTATLPREDEEDDDEWDTDGFVIPTEQDNKVNDSEADTSSPQMKAEENVGPHGGAPPPLQLQDGNAAGRKKQRFKQKLKEADQKMNVSGRENKVANLRELVGRTELTTCQILVFQENGLTHIAMSLCSRNVNNCNDAPLTLCKSVLYQYPERDFNAIKRLPLSSLPVR